MFAPSRAARSAIASPMPRLPPDIRMVLPASGAVAEPVEELLIGSPWARSAGCFGAGGGERGDAHLRLLGVEARADRCRFVVEVLGERAVGTDAHEALGLAVRGRRVL